MDASSLVGFEGLWGILISSTVISILVFVNCPSIFDDCPGGKFESINIFIQDVFTDS